MRPAPSRDISPESAAAARITRSGVAPVARIGHGLMARPVFPFAAIVGQEDMKLAMLIAAVDHGIGGVLVFGDRGTGKSTTVARWPRCCRR